MSLNPLQIFGSTTSTSTLPYEFLWLNLQHRILNCSDKSRGHDQTSNSGKPNQETILFSLVKECSEALQIF